MNVPEEIIEKILYNLRPKSLLRFQCVSKRWRSIISSKEFITEHLKKSSTNPDYTHHMIVFKFHHWYLRGDDIGSCSLRHFLDGPTTIFDDHHPSRREILGRHTQLWGSCNGLTLMTLHTMELALFNPETLNTKKIRHFRSRKDVRVSDRFVYGFGYYEPTDEYKVVCIYTIFDSEPHETHVYSSKTLSWKRIGDFDKGFPADDSGKFVDGKLHWLAEQDGGDLDIVSLDLVDEKYEIVAKPENIPTSIPYQTILGDLGGYLSMISYAPMLDTNVWVMKRYGVRESWTKIWTLSDFVDPKTHVRGAMPLFLKDNGDIAVALGSGVVVCNGKNKLHETRATVFDNLVGSIVCVGSLVPPFGDEELLF